MKATVQTSPFAPSGGGAREFHSFIRISDSSLVFAGQLSAMVEAIAGLAAQDGVEIRFVRFFLSDPANQLRLLRDAIEPLALPAVSVVGQAPLDGSRIAAWVYSCEAHESAVRQMWSAGMCSIAEGPHEQMGEIFGNYGKELASRGMSVADSCVRTWIFVHDVDNNYAGAVRGRCEFFDGIGLTPQTHYIASTGIEGRSSRVGSLVSMDALSLEGLRPGQVRYLHAREFMSHTYDYKVTFERGTAVSYSDRMHVFVSGTASIDRHGATLYPCDAARQTERMLDNVAALLGEASACFGDIVMATVYLRDAADLPCVEGIILSRCPGLNAEYVLAPVCRPEWLVEMECIAVRNNDDPSLPDF